MNIVNIKRFQAAVEPYKRVYGLVPIANCACRAPGAEPRVAVVRTNEYLTLVEELETVSCIPLSDPQQLKPVLSAKDVGGVMLVGSDEKHYRGFAVSAMEASGCTAPTSIFDAHLLDGSPRLHHEAVSAAARKAAELAAEDGGAAGACGDCSGLCALKARESLQQWVDSLGALNTFG